MELLSCSVYARSYKIVEGSHTPTNRDRVKLLEMKGKEDSINKIGIGSLF